MSKRIRPCSAWVEGSRLRPTDSKTGARTISLNGQCYSSWPAPLGTTSPNVFISPRIWLEVSSLAIGVQVGPPIGAEQGPPRQLCGTLMLGASFALLVA